MWNLPNMPKGEHMPDLSQDKIHALLHHIQQAAQGCGALAIVVVDASGLELATCRQGGTTRAYEDMALMRAQMATDQTPPPNGSALLYAGGSLVGAVGVSTEAGQRDHELAMSRPQSYIL